MRHLFKNFLQLPGIFTEISNYVDELVNDKSKIITNIMQGKFWRQNCINRENLKIWPLYVYYDELECGNALGSVAGKNKFGAIYTQLACLPPKIASSLKTIFLYMLLHAEDAKKMSNKNIFNHLICELKSISEHGIEILDGSTKHTIYLKLVLVLGDNLGLNDILGFVTSFNSNCYCRVCILNREQASYCTTECKSMLRTKENYCTQVKMGDPTFTGIQETCVFHSMDFHVIENWCLDMLHDFLEGVCTYDLHAVFSHFIIKKQLFTLELLNNCIQNFNYGSLRNINKPPKITMNHLITRNTLIMSAAETLCLIRFLPLMIGHLIPENNEHWKIIIYLRRILDILTSRVTTESRCKLLKYLVDKHHTLYLELFGLLKPKYHFLIHYYRMLLEFGPCVNYCTMRFESRHRQIKAVAQTSCNKQNMLYTIGIKEALNFCQMTHSAKLEKINAFFENDTTCNDKSIIYYNSIIEEGLFFKCGMFIVFRIDTTLKYFGMIEQIVKSNKKTFFTLHMYREIYFDSHYHSYVIERCTEEDLTIEKKKIANV